MRNLYFVSVNGLDWTIIESHDMRKVRVKADEMYPQGMYGPIYIGVWRKTNEVEKILKRSARVNEQRTHWERCDTPVCDRTSEMIKRCGVVYWLSVDNSDKKLLLSSSLKAAKQTALRSPLLKSGSRVEIFCQTRTDIDQKLIEIGDCDDQKKVKWRWSVVETVTQITK